MVRRFLLSLHGYLLDSLKQHAIGEVWAEMLWITSQRLIAKHGYSDTLFPPAPLADGTVPEGDFYRPAKFNAKGERMPLVPKHGNSLMVQCVYCG